MSDEEALLHAIARHPDEDLPRLVYADWLDDHAQELNGRIPQEVHDRATFIRLQVAVARTEMSKEERERLDTAANDLLVNYRDEWEAPLHGLITRVWFRRGFPETVSFPLTRPLPNTRQIFEAAPMIMQLRFSNPDCLGGVPVEDVMIERLSAIYELSNVRSLEICHGRLYGGRGIRKLAASPHVQNITKLSVVNCGYVADAVQQLTASAYFRNLTALDLGGSRIGPRGAACLAAEGSELKNLTVLKLGNCDIGDQGAQALASSANVRRLSHLELYGNDISEDGARVLAASPHLGGLKVLNLRCNWFGTQWLRPFAETTTLPPEMKLIANEFDGTLTELRVQLAGQSPAEDLLELPSSRPQATSSARSQVGRGYR